MAVFEVKAVKLYKMGVGWLSAQSSFKQKEVLFPILTKSQDDFLKTFHVEIIEGDSFLSSISFDTELYDDIQINYSGDAFCSLLDLLSGSEVDLLLIDGETISGRLIGYQVLESEKDDAITKIDILIASEDQQIHHILSVKVQSLKPKEAYFHQLLRDQLDMLSKSKKEETRQIKLSFSEEGEKTVQINYLTSLPAWQSSYRIYALDEDNAIFELWALVTNNTPTDWIDAKIQLVTETPISFNYDMSTPWEITRPYVERPKQLGVSVMTPEAEYEDETFGAETDMIRAPLPASAPKKSAMRPRAKMMATMLEESYDDYEYKPTVETSADVVSTVEGVAFSLTQPVTIKKGESALLLLQTTEVPASQIYIYNQENNLNHPFRALEVINESGYSWEAGPVTVYLGGEYAGEAMIPKVPKDAKQIVPFQLDQEVRVKQTEITRSEKIGISLSGAYFVELFLNRNNYKLEIDNKSKEEKTLFCEIPKLYGYEVDKKKCKVEFEETPNYFRIKVNLPAKNLKKIEFPTFRKTSQSTSISSISDLAIEELLKLDTINEKQSKLLKQIKKLREEKRQIRSKIRKEENNLNKIDKEYERITSSVNVLKTQGEEGKTRAKYVTRMNTLFETMEEKRKAIEELQFQEEEIEKQLEVALGKL
ncbi:MAG: hypothetical protein ACTSQE_13755 [Candidatus Heimdallarchaeaceae archaeon]